MLFFRSIILGAFIVIIPAAAGGGILHASGLEQYLQALSSPTASVQKGEIYLHIGEWYQNNNDNRKAIDAFLESLKYKLKPEQASASQRALGDLYLVEKQYEASINAYRQAKEFLPKDEQVRLRLACAYEQSELTEQAIQEYAELIRILPGSFEGHFRLAFRYETQGLHGKALDSYRKALLIDPRDKVYVHISRCAEKTGNIDLAIATLRDAAAKEQRYDYCMKLGQLHLQKQNQSEAEEMFSKAVKISPEEAEAYLSLGILYMEQEKFKPAEQLFAIALEKARDKGLAHFYLGTVYFRQALYEKAQKEVAQAAALAKSEALRAYARRLLAYMNVLPAGKK